MVSVAETVVHEDAVMIEFLHTSIAEVTMVCILRPKSFTRHTDIVQMIIFSNQFF
jgi:hypothetical protein